MADKKNGCFLCLTGTLLGADSLIWRYCWSHDEVKNTVWGGNTVRGLIWNGLDFLTFKTFDSKTALYRSVTALHIGLYSSGVDWDHRRSLSELVHIIVPTLHLKNKSDLQVLFVHGRAFAALSCTLPHKIIQRKSAEVRAAQVLFVVKLVHDMYP